MNLYACIKCRWPMCLRELRTNDKCPKCDNATFLDLGESAATNHKKMTKLVDELWFPAWIAYQEAVVAAEKAAQEEEARQWQLHLFNKKYRNKVCLSTGPWNVKAMFVGQIEDCYKVFKYYKKQHKHPGTFTIRDYFGDVLETHQMLELDVYPFDYEEDYLYEGFYS